MKPLPKSLHTVTAVSWVAAFIKEINPLVKDDPDAVRRALDVLGYSMAKLPRNDPTVVRCIAAVGDQEN